MLFLWYYICVERKGDKMRQAMYSQWDDYFEENRGLEVENRELKEENERLKKELEYQELKNSRLTDANVKQFETIMQRNAEVRALKHMLDRLEENE